MGTAGYERMDTCTKLAVKLVDIMLWDKICV